MLDLVGIFEGQTFNQETINALKELGFANKEALNRFLELLASMDRKASSGDGQTPKLAIKLGLSYLVLGNIEAAVNWLEKAEDSPEKHYYLGLAYRDMNRHRDSLAQFEKGTQAGYDKLLSDCQRAETFILLEELDKASEILERNAGPGRENAQWHYTWGRYYTATGDWDRAMDEFEAALRLDDLHAHATFHLAYLLDLHGSDEQAKNLYLSACEFPFVHVNALMNLAILLEDEGKFEKAADYLHRVLSVVPNHARAKLYWKDVAASCDMYIDERMIKANEKRSAVLDTPISDFELSVRSRNCLKKMNINTLGDLLSTTEAELLAYKNFGETSLKEIRTMLTQKGLTLGQNAHMKTSPSLPPPADDEADMDFAANPEMMGRPVVTLELSVRSRKCLQRLGIQTVGELCRRTEEELLESRNFGQTSLLEIKKGLGDLGLTLRGGE